MAKGIGQVPKTDPIDQGALIAVISLVISVLSTLVCVGQMLQQYIGTAAAIKLCDGAVFGGRNGLPGQGRRYWSWRQFRFRIIYEIPQISLVPLPPTVGMFVPFMIKPSPSFDWPPPERKLMSQLRHFNNKPAIGEASWTSFCRVLLQACPGSVIVNRVRGDTDRCPSDMTNIPMPVSLRDIAIFCLFVGMECTHASFADGTIAMSGPVGSITSSSHPTLGSCLHFAPAQDGYRLDRIGVKIDTTWILRVCGRFRVANTIIFVGSGPAKSSGLRSPFDDPSSEEYEDEDVAKIHSHVAEDVKLVTLPGLDFYWMSQMGVMPGFWATPFKSSASASLSCFWGAHEVVLKTFADMFYREATAETYALAYWQDTKTPNVLCGTSITTYPPYGLRHGGGAETMTRETMQLFGEMHDYVESAQFDSHIPRLLIRRESLTPAAHARLADHYLCSVEIMAMDVWLSVVSKTLPIIGGRRQILGRVPTMLQNLADQHSKSWEEACHGGRAEVEACSAALQASLRELILSDAERMFILAALLRTVKVGLCLALGNDSNPLLEIIEKNVQAHLL